MTTTSRSWVPPDGLDRARPREVRLTKAGWSLVVGIAILLAAVPSTFITLQFEARRQGRERRLFVEQAAPATGEVVRLWRGRGDKKDPWMRYAFTVDGRRYDGQAKLGLSHWRQLRAGDAVPVRYLPFDPGVHRAFGQKPRALPIGLSWLSAGFLAALAAALAWPLARQRHLLMQGRAAPGRVTRHERGQKAAAWFFEFTVLSGARREGRALVATPQGGKPRLPEIGTPICVLYDAENDRRHAPYPLSLFEPARKESLVRRIALSSRR